ncbi:hypothetical protein ACFE04_001687 [Oxalis oulophora]
MSTFESSLRRGRGRDSNTTNNNNNNNNKVRRSRSRDNPLFTQTNNNTTNHDLNSRRGRSIAPKSDDTRNSTAGRSLSRSAPTDTTARRGRSVSRGPVSRRQFLFSESEVEQEDAAAARFRNATRTTLSAAAAAATNPKKAFNTRTTTSDHQSLSSLRTRNSQDSVSVTSLSEVEEKTIKAVSEQIKSFHRDDFGGDVSNGGIYETVRSEVRRAIAEIQSDREIAIRRSSPSIATASVTDIPPELVNPGAVELVQDIRREYASKLEESQERARQLRADLAVEEHRGLELGRILKEMLPEPKSSNGQKSRTGRKNSMERRKISNSKRLTEEAMAYFDECVSLSTFDSSDFSSPEDPPLNLAGFTTPVSDSTINFARSRLNDKQDGWSTAQSHVPLHQSASSSTKEGTLDRVNLTSTNPELTEKYQFSVNNSPTEGINPQQDIMKYVQNFEKDQKKVNIHSLISKPSNYDMDDYSLHESLLFDQVLMNKRLESGSLLLCGAISFCPFASLL